MTTNGEKIECEVNFNDHLHMHNRTSDACCRYESTIHFRDLKCPSDVCCFHTRSPKCMVLPHLQHASSDVRVGNISAAVVNEHQGCENNQSDIEEVALQ